MTRGVAGDISSTITYGAAARLAQNGLSQLYSEKDKSEEVLTNIRINQIWKKALSNL